MFFLFKQKTAYEMRISDWSSDVCSSDLIERNDLKARRGIFHGMPDSSVTTPDNQLVIILRAEDMAFQRCVATPPISRREGPGRGVIGTNVSHGAEQSRCGENVVRGHFHQMIDFGDSATQHGDGRPERRISPQQERKSAV